MASLTFGFSISIGLLEIVLFIPVAIVVGLIEFFFWCTHRHPLTDEEVERLAEIRRKKGIAAYFEETKEAVAVNPDFKANMKADGKLYTIDLALSKMPAIAGGLLKGKKHEWILVALEQGGTVCRLWANKGADRSSVGLKIGFDSLLEVANDLRCTSVIIFHNHPNTDPSHFDCTKPSQQDKRSAAIFSESADAHGLNLVEYVCERGTSYKYFEHYCASFFPASDYKPEIIASNGKSKKDNYQLQRELRNGKSL